MYTKTGLNPFATLFMLAALGPPLPPPILLKDPKQRRPGDPWVPNPPRCGGSASVRSKGNRCDWRKRSDQRKADRTQKLNERVRRFETPNPRSRPKMYGRQQPRGYRRSAWCF